MSQPNDCTHCAEWEICPFHPKPALETRGATTERASSSTPCASNRPQGPGLRLLGPDDPEVSDDLVYLDEATGGVVGVPQRPAASAPHTGVTIGGLHLQRSDYRVVTVTPGCGRFRITLPLGSERETKLNAMYQADQLALRYNPRIPLVQVDAPALQVRTDRGWFLSRLVGVPAAATVTYVMGFVR